MSRASRRLLTLLRRRGGVSIVTDGLVCEYRFDDGSGQVLTDYSGNDYHLQLGSDAEAGGDANDPSWVTEGLSFARPSAETRDWCAPSGAVNAALMPDAFTAMGVFQATSTDRMNMISWGSGANSHPSLAYYWTDESQPIIFLGANSNRVFENTAALNDGVWRVVTFIVPGAAQASISSSQCYVDKTALSAASTTATGAQTAKDAFVIGSPVNVTSWFVGKQGFFAMWNRVLTEAEIFQNVDYITALMGGRGVTVPFDPALVPNTKVGVYFDSGISHRSASAIVDTWSGTGGGLVNDGLPGAYVFPADDDGIHGFVGGATYGMQTAALNLSQPFTIYALVNWQFDAIGLPEGNIGCLGYFNHASEDVSLHISSSEADDQIQASSGNTQTNPDSEIVIGPVPDRTWTRVRAVFNGASSLLQVEGTTETGTLNDHDASGIMKVLDWSVYLAHWQIINGTVSDANHEQMWAYLENLKADLPTYSSTIVQPVDGKYRALGCCKVYDTDKLVAAYYCGDGHSTADSDLRLTTSADGVTWAAEAVIADVHVAGYHMRDCNISVLASGRWVVTWTETNPAFTGEYNKAWSMYSDNTGTTWSVPVQIPLHASVTTTAVASDITELASGDLIITTYGRAAADGDNIVLVYRSTDSAASWAYDGTVPSSTLGNESIIRELASGNLLMLVRFSAALKYSVCTDSTATPLVWSAPATTNLIARAKPYFIQLADGTLVLWTRNYRGFKDLTTQAPPCLHTSSDGETWSLPPIHPEPTYNAQMYGNPLMYDGTLHVFWSQEAGSGATLFWRDISAFVT